MDISRLIVEKPRFIEVEKYVENRTSSIAQLLKAIDNDALVSGEVTKGPRTAAQRLPRHMRRRAMAYDIRRFPRTMREFAASHLISKHAKKCPSRFARRKTKNKFGRRNSVNGTWLSTHVWHAKRFRMLKKWGFKIADRSFQRGFRSVLRDSHKNCVIRDRSFYTCVTIECTDAYSAISPFTQSACRKQSSRGEEEECHQLYVPGSHPFGYIGPARFQKNTNELSGKLNVWLHPSSKSQFLKCFIGFYKLEARAESDEERYKNEKMKVTVDSENVCRFHLSGPKCLQKLRDSIRLVKNEKFTAEHIRFLSHVNSVFSSLPDGKVLHLLIEDPRCAWDRKTELKHNQINQTEQPEEILSRKNEPFHFWDRCFRDKAASDRMTDSEFQKQNSIEIGGVISTNAKVPIVLIIRNEGLKALDGVDILVPEPFAKDLWVSLQRRGVRASGLRDEYAAHLESETLYYPHHDVDSEAGKESESMMKKESEGKFLSKPHNRRCKFWSYLSIKYPFEYQWNILATNWNDNAEKGAYVCRDLIKLKKIKHALNIGVALGEELKDPGMLIPVKLHLVGRGRPKSFGIICLPTSDDLISVRKDRNREIMQTPPSMHEIDDVPTVLAEPEERGIERKQLEGFVSLEAAASENPINLKTLFEETDRLDDKSAKRKRVNRKKKESKKRRKLETEARVSAVNEEEKQKQSVEYRFSANREIIGRIVAGEQSVLSGHGVAVGYICADALDLIASNYNKAKTIVLVRNSTSKYYHPAYVKVLTKALQI